MCLGDAAAHITTIAAAGCLPPASRGRTKSATGSRDGRDSKPAQVAWRLVCHLAGALATATPRPAPRPRAGPPPRRHFRRHFGRPPPYRRRVSARTGVPALHRARQIDIAEGQWPVAGPTWRPLVRIQIRIPHVGGWEQRSGLAGTAGTVRSGCRGFLYSAKLAVRPAGRPLHPSVSAPLLHLPYYTTHTTDARRKNNNAPKREGNKADSERTGARISPRPSSPPRRCLQCGGARTRRRRRVPRHASKHNTRRDSAPHGRDARGPSPALSATRACLPNGGRGFRFRAGSAYRCSRAAPSSAASLKAQNYCSRRVCVIRAPRWTSDSRQRERKWTVFQRRNNEEVRKARAGPLVWEGPN